MRTLSDAIKNNVNGLFYGNRVLLPFEADILKIVFDTKIITDFSSLSEEVEYDVNDGFTEIYFHQVESIEDKISEYESIKFVLVEKGKDLFDFTNHKLISASIKDNHQLLIKELDEDILFIE